MYQAEDYINANIILLFEDRFKTLFNGKYYFTWEDAEFDNKTTYGKIYTSAPSLFINKDFKDVIPLKSFNGDIEYYALITKDIFEESTTLASKFAKQRKNSKITPNIRSGKALLFDVDGELHVCDYEMRLYKINYSEIKLTYKHKHYISVYEEGKLIEFYSPSKR